MLGILDPALDATDPDLRRLIRSQRTGQCFMRDMDDRVEQISTAFYLESLRLAFETNANDRSRISLAEVRDALAGEFGVDWTPPADRISNEPLVTAGC